MRKKRIVLMGLLAVFLLLPMTAMADSISPTSVSSFMNIGGSINITKTVTVSEEPPVGAPVDVFFLADSTGSMGGEIAAVKTSMSSILAATAGLGDVRYGVGEYRDTAPPDYHSSSFGYRLDQAITDSTTAVQYAINTLAAGEGYDWPEANLFALNEVATQPATGWRAGSTRIIVWFGDAPGHEPSTEGVTLSQTITSLQAANISVEALDVGTSYSGLDSTDQATAITTATGGHLYTGINSSSIATTIQNAITTAIETYSTVGLDLSEAPTGLTVTAVPSTVTGSFDRSVERTFNFNLTLTGDSAGVYDFNVYATVDGGRVATENDHIVVGGAPAVPEPGTMLLFGVGLLGGAGIIRKRMK